MRGGKDSYVSTARGTKIPGVVTLPPSPRGQVLRLDNLSGSRGVKTNVIAETDLRSFQTEKQIRHLEVKKKQKESSENLLQAKNRRS